MRINEYLEQCVLSPTNITTHKQNMMLTTHTVSDLRFSVLKYYTKPIMYYFFDASEYILPDTSKFISVSISRRYNTLKSLLEKHDKTFYVTELNKLIGNYILTLDGYFATGLEVIYNGAIYAIS